MPREKTYPLRLTKSELQLVFTEFNVSCDCGAEDPDFPKVRDKADALLREAALGVKESSNGS
jgi:hypothetical protein